MPTARGFSDLEIATKLNRTEFDVQGCTAWIVHFLGLKDRVELVGYASAQ